jgi:hypothetical protein
MSCNYNDHKLVRGLHNGERIPQYRSEPCNRRAAGKRNRNVTVFIERTAQNHPEPGRYHLRRMDG